MKKPVNKHTNVLSLIYHKNWLKNIREQVKECTFISHVKDGENFLIKAKMKNDLGGKDTIEIPLNVSPDKMNNSDYSYVLKMLKTKEYERSQETIPEP